MSTRRPRIKASANLSLASKRKPKSLTDACEKVKNVGKSDDVNNSESVQNIETDSVLNKEETKVENSTPDNGTKYVGRPLSPPILVNPWNTNELSQNRLKPFEDGFKYPQNPEYKRPLTTNTVEENFTSDFEDNILHIDLQKSPGFPMSPTKSRQRIRPTPIFGQRRNSFVGSSPSPHTEDEPTVGTRQRSSNSTSSDISSNFFVRRFAAGNIGRIRTESGCSTISESRGSTRKNQNEEYRNVTKREYQNRFNGKVPDKSTLKMFDLIYYNPSTNPMEQKTSGAIQNSAESESISPDETSKQLEITPESTSHSAMPVPQLKLGSNGEMMIDEKSLEIETTAEVEARKLLANTSLIYHDENTGSEGFYRKHKRTKDWLPEETIKFYRCLQTVGTDFSLMLTLFPNRTRRDLKLKFKKEERCNLNLINKALLYPGTFNIEDLKEQLDAEEEERREQERLWKEIKAKEPKKIKKVTNASSSSSRVLVPGDDIYQNENITKGKLSKRLVTSVNVQQSKQKRKRLTSELVSDRSLNSIDENILENELNDILDPTGIPDDIIDSVSDDSSLNEASISIILNELANGTLAYVSSVDPKSPDKIINEIYVLDKESGQLSDKPLDLPEEIIDAIRSVMIS